SPEQDEVRPYERRLPSESRSGPKPVPVATRRVSIGTETRCFQHEVPVEFRILGPLEVVGESGPIRLGGRKQRGVLTILLLHANGVVAVDRIADDLYGGSPPPTAGSQVRAHVSQLRKLLGPEAGDAVGHG